MAVQTLRMVFGADTPGQLLYQSYEPRGGPIEIPELGIARDLRADLRIALGAYTNEQARAIVDSMDPYEGGDRLLKIVGSDKQPQAVASAADLLADIGDPRAPDLLVELANHPSSIVQWRALSALGRLGDPRVEGLLIRELESQASANRQSAAMALAKYHDQSSRRALIAALQDPDRYVRVAAIRSLAAAKDPSMFDLIAAHLQDPDSRVREDVWKALEEFRGTEAAPKLRALEEKESERILAAFRSQRGHQSWRSAFRRSSYGPDVFYVSDAIEPYIVALCKLLAVPHGVKGQLYSPAYEVWSFLDGGVLKIHPYGMGSERGTRVFGFGALRYLSAELGLQPPARRLKGESQTPPLDELRARVEHLSSPDEANSEQVVDSFLASHLRPLQPAKPTDMTSALLELPQVPEDDISALLTLIRLPRDTDWNRRYAAQEALRRLPVERVLPSLVEALKDPDPALRAGAAGTLAHMDDPRIGELMVGLLSDPDPSVRNEAVVAFFSRRLPEAIEPLALLLRDPNLCPVVINALSYQGSRGQAAMLDELEGLLATDVEAAIRFGYQLASRVGRTDRGSALLIRALDSQIPELRTAAASLLGSSHPQAGIGPLIEHLLDPADRVRARVEEALLDYARYGARSGADPLPALFRALESRDWKHRLAVAKLLGKIKPSRSSEMIKALNDPRAEVRLALLESLRPFWKRMSSRALEALTHDPDERVRQLTAGALTMRA